MKQALWATLFAAAAAVQAAPAFAQFAKPEEAVRYRQGALAVMGEHFGRLGAMVHQRIPYDPRVAQENAEVVAGLARLPWAGFGPGTDRISPKARPEIWTDPAGFREHNEKLVVETGKLLAAARSNSLDSLKAAFAATANTCKACHDSFRNK